MQTPNEWPWDLELVFVNINKLICKLVEGLRFFKAEYNSTWWSKMDQKWSKNGPKMDRKWSKIFRPVKINQNQAGKDPIQSERK